MSITLLNRRLSFLIGFIKRSIAIQSDFDLGTKMKLLNNNKQFEKTLELFNKYTKNKVETCSSLTITQALKACAHLENLQRGETIHHLISSRIRDDYYILASLIHLYMQCGKVVRAQSLFDMTTKKTSSMYGAMMKGYIKNNLPHKAIDLFNEIKDPSEVNIIILFNACAQLRSAEALNIVKTVSQQIPKYFHSNVRLLTSLVDALMKCGDIKYAELLFSTSKEKVLPMYGAMMKGYIENNQANKAIDLFNEIKNPNEIIINLLFNACAQLGNVEALNIVKKVSQQIPEYFHSNVRLLTSLVDALMKCGDIKYAELLFSTSKEKVLPMYGAMMKGYIENNQANKAIDLFNEIKNPNEIIINLLFNACAQLGNVEALNIVKKVSQQIPKYFHSNSHVSTSLLDALIKCGDCSSAEVYFLKIPKSLVNYGNLMSGFNLENNPSKTLDLFNKMKVDGIEGDLIIYLLIIQALSRVGDYELSQSVIQQIPKSFIVDHRIQTALIDMWGKTGYVDEGKRIFERIVEPDHVTYTAMINSYGLNGQGIQAIELYRKMPSKLINEVTHICVLNACSHSGLVDVARLIFKNIQIKTQRIYGTMIDCLSRASLFREARQLIDEYECDHSPVLAMYMALLSGARNMNNIDLSQNIYDRMKKIFPQITDSLIPAAVLLANTYGSSGYIDKASNIRNQLHESNTKKQIGLTWTVTNGKVYQFRAHDQSHPRSKEIYDEGKKISTELKAHGHQYDSSWITRPLDKNETVESVLCGHSERLAIAWNFVVNSNASRIQMTKNLRVCGDCHRATKLIAAIRQCEIIVRDANRIHHFYTNGQCSCNDYF